MKTLFRIIPVIMLTGLAIISCGKKNPAGPDVTPQATRTITATPTEAAEICGDGLDNDNDGLTDCEDPDCPCYYPTLTVTVTETGTPEDTVTMTATVTLTETDTPEDTSTETLTITETATVTETETAEDSATETETPTVTETGTATSTYTVSSTPTDSPTTIPLSQWNKLTDAAGFTARYAFASAVSNNKLWVMGGYDGALKNDVYSSSDGISRGTVTGAASFVPRDYFSGVEFDNGTGNKLWVIGGGRSGGYNNDVWYSANGAAWGCTTTAAAFPGRFSHACAVFDEGTGNKMWVIGGYDGNNSVYLKDVWYSSNGADWTNATGNAAFGLRDGASSVVFAGRLWVIAGYDGTQSCKDVWYTMNGADWIQATGNAAFGRRMGHSSVVYDNKMWVIGGVDGIFYFNDVWYSTNGADWVQATPNGVFMRRAYHSSMVMNGKVYVLGGVTSGGTRLNDVWQSQ